MFDKVDAMRRQVDAVVGALLDEIGLGKMFDDHIDPMILHTDGFTNGVPIDGLLGTAFFKGQFVEFEKEEFVFGGGFFHFFFNLAPLGVSSMT